MAGNYFVRYDNNIHVYIIMKTDITGNAEAVSSFQLKSDEFLIQESLASRSDKFIYTHERTGYMWYFANKYYILGLEGLSSVEEGTWQLYE
ncbi:hypothetical protein K8I31_21595 [bacterium]|nr:hypothetical protein [bacterium]